MSEIDELPSWAGRSLEQTATVPTPEPVKPRRRLRRLSLTLLGLVMLGGLVAAGYWFTTQSDDTNVAADATPVTTATTTNADTETAAEGDGSDSADDSETAAPTTVATTTPSTGEAAITEAATEESEDGDAANDGSTGSADDNIDGDVRHAVFKGGQVFLRGRVPSKEVGDEIEQKAGLVVGPDNVFNEYEIDPSVPVSVSAPLYVEDVVLFGFNSIRIETPFLPILDLGTLLLVQNPNVTITVVTRTDAVGSEAMNMNVSRLRAQAVINYWLGKGIDPSRLIADPRGEEMASEDDDEQTASLNRRAEFIITGLLD